MFEASGERAARHGVPEALYSCHTALVDRYVIEGHVPADLIARLLKERPTIKGLAVPAMPAGAPGMGGSGRYEILSFDHRGRFQSYSRR